MRMLTWTLVVSSFAFVPAARADGPEPPAPATKAGVAFEPGPPHFADVLAKAKAQKKRVFIDFSADG